MSVGQLIASTVAGTIYSVLRTFVVLFLRSQSWIQVPSATVISLSEKSCVQEQNELKTEIEEENSEEDDGENGEPEKEDEENIEEELEEEKKLSPEKEVNLNRNKKFNILDSQSCDVNCKRTSGEESISDISFENNFKKKNEAVKNNQCSGGDKENFELDDNVFSISTSSKNDWPKREKRARRSSECVQAKDRRTDRSSPPLSQGRIRSILKRRGRSYSESHVGSLEECLGEELLGKYGSVERALVGEYGCLEGLIEECGWGEEEEVDEDESSGSVKKSVRFNDVEKRHLFLSKHSIVNQLANDDKRAKRMKIKEQKKQIRLQKRQALKTGKSFSPNKQMTGYSEDEFTTEESDAGDLLSSSSAGETTEDTDTDTSGGTDQNTKPAKSKIMNPSVVLNVRGKKGRRKKGNMKGKRVELTNNMVFQLDIDA